MRKTTLLWVCLLKSASCQRFHARISSASQQRFCSSAYDAIFWPCGTKVMFYSWQSLPGGTWLLEELLPSPYFLQKLPPVKWLFQYHKVWSRQFLITDSRMEGDVRSVQLGGSTTQGSACSLKKDLLLQHGTLFFFFSLQKRLKSLFMFCSFYFLLHSSWKEELTSWSLQKSPSTGNYIRGWKKRNIILRYLSIVQAAWSFFRGSNKWQIQMVLLNPENQWGPQN